MSKILKNQNYMDECRWCLGIGSGVQSEIFRFPLVEWIASMFSFRLAAEPNDAIVSVAEIKFKAG